MPWCMNMLIIQHNGTCQFYHDFSMVKCSFRRSVTHVVLVSSSVCGVFDAAGLRPRRVLPGDGWPAAGPRAEPACLLHMRSDGVWGGLHSTRTGEMLENTKFFQFGSAIVECHTQRNMFRWDLCDGSFEYQMFLLNLPTVNNRPPFWV